MGNALAGEMMRDGIAIGADKGVLVSDERMAGSDTLATGLVLAKAIEKLGGADLVFTGKRSTDGDTGQIPPAIAQRLGMALISYAHSVSVDGTTVTELFAPEPNPVGVMIEGATPADAAANLVKELTAKNLL